MRFEKRTPTDGGSYLKLKDGESKTGVFRGDIYEYAIVWEARKSREVAKNSPGAKARFRLNFVVREDGELKAKIFDFGLTLYNQLAGISEEYDLEKTALKITRQGTGTDTVYVIIPSKEQPNEKALEQLSSVKLNYLESKKPSLPLRNFAPEADETEGYF